MTGWVARFGVPLQMTSDRGRQFISSLCSKMARSLGTQLHRTTSYHPQANGMVERFHRSLKASLRARLHDGNWIDELPWVLLGLRTATKEDLQTSPAEMVFGDSPLLPGEFASSGKTPFFPSFTQTSTSSPQHHRVDTPTPLATLARRKYVFVRVGPQHPSLQRPYQGPFKVIQTGNKTFKVLMNKGPQTISVDRLKPAKVSPQTQTRAGRIVNEPDRWHYWTFKCALTFMYSCIHCISLHYYARPDFGGSSVAIAHSTIAITHRYIISIQIAIMSIVKPCLHITMK